MAFEITILHRTAAQKEKKSIIAKMNNSILARNGHKSRLLVK